MDLAPQTYGAYPDTSSFEGGSLRWPFSDNTTSGTFSTSDVRPLFRSSNRTEQWPLALIGFDLHYEPTNLAEEPTKNQKDHTLTTK